MLFLAYAFIFLLLSSGWTVFLCLWSGAASFHGFLVCVAVALVFSAIAFAAAGLFHWFGPVSKYGYYKFMKWDKQTIKAYERDLKRMGGA